MTANERPDRRNVVFLLADQLQAAGVEVRAFTCRVEPERMELDREIPVELPELSSLEGPRKKA